MLAYGVISCGILRRRLRTAVRLERNVFQSEAVRSLFILGVFRARIYLPYGLEDDTQRYVLAHEHHHLKCMDHIVKLFAFVLLSLHWMNPLVWSAFLLMSRDMEMRCDEAVLGAQENIRRAYSHALLTVATGRRTPLVGPLAFGERDVKTRVKNALNYKKPALWITVGAAVLCGAVVLLCACDPSDPDPADVVGATIRVRWAAISSPPMLPPTRWAPIPTACRCSAIPARRWAWLDESE